MAINLQKGQRIEIGLQKVGVGLGWDPNEGSGEKLDSKTITVIRFVLVIFVVFAHINFYIDGWKVGFAPNSPLNMPLFELHCIKSILSGIGPATFFVIAGYLFYKKLEDWNWAVWKSKMYKRLFSMLIPFLIWNFLYIVYWKAYPITLSQFWCSVSDDLTQKDLLGNPSYPTYPFLIPLWFVRDLMVILLFTPPLHYLLQDRVGHRNGIVLLAILFSVSSLGISTTVPGLRFSSFFWFSLGGYFSINHRSFTTACRKIPVIAFFLFVIFSTFNIMNQIGIIHIRYIGMFRLLLGVVTVINIGAWMVSSTNKHVQSAASFLSRLSPCVFFVFVGHMFFLPYAKTIFLKLMKIVAGYPKIAEIMTAEFVAMHPIGITINFFAGVFITVSVCVVLYFVLQKCMPRTMKFLCGR